MGCSGHPVSPPEVTHAEDAFLVIVGYPNRPSRVPSAEVIAVTREGMIPVATTDKAGVAEIERSVLEESSVLLVCSKGFFCGALRVEAEELVEFKEFNQFYIELAPQSFL